MKKKIYIIIAIVAIITISLAFYFFIYSNKLVISTNEGKININNIYRGQTEIYKDGSVTYKANNDYSLFYNPNDQTFNISLMNSDVKNARNKAETDFLKILNINEKDACKLNVILAVPPSVDENYAGTNYGLSFCSNGIPFK
jgi:hypothetical protein